MRQSDLLSRAFFVLCAFGTVALSMPDAQAQSGVKAIFEKYKLLGAQSWDCNKPPDANNNWRFVNRLIDADRVQRDFMTTATNRLWSAILDKADELGLKEISVAGTRNGKRTIGVWRIDGNRMLQWQAEEDGQTLVVDGKWKASGKQLPWLNKCGN